jgi:hypothetical protein
MTPIDIDKWERAIRDFNGDEQTFAIEALVHRHFRDTAHDRTLIAERVILLDKMWATQMYRRRGHIDKVIRNLRRGEEKIIEACCVLPFDAIEMKPEQIGKIAKWAMPVALGHVEVVDEPQRPYAPYSFATKYLHWITRGQFFPIVDSYARKYVYRLQHECDMTPRVSAGQCKWPDDYPRWITFYSELLRSVSPGDRERLQRADYDSQPPGHRYPNTLLRILDKAFYWLGDSDDTSPAD